MAPEILAVVIPGQNAGAVVGVKGLHLAVGILKEGKTRFGEAGIIIIHSVKTGVGVAILEQIIMGYGNTVLSAAQSEAITAPALDHARLKIFVITHCLETDIIDQRAIFNGGAIGEIVQAN